MRRIRLRDLFAGQPARRSRSQGKGGKDKPAKQLPFDADGLIERALDGDVPDVEGFVFDALRTLRKLWSSLDDGTERESSLLDQVKRSGTSDRRRTTCLRATHRQK